MPPKTDKKRKGVLLFNAQIERTAKRLFAQHIWIEKYGKPLYNLRRPSKVEKILNVKTIGDEWDVIQFRSRWYVFLSSDRTTNSPNQTRLKLSPPTVQRIRETDFSVKGVQRKLAKELGIHESHLSRVRRGISRTEPVEAREFTVADKEKLFLSRSEINDFFSIMMTGTEFYRKYHSAYQIRNVQRVYDMCSGRNYAKFPGDWLTVRVSDHWLIYSKASLTSRSDSSQD